MYEKEPKVLVKSKKASDDCEAELFPLFLITFIIW